MEERRRAVSARARLQEVRLAEAGFPPDKTLTCTDGKLQFSRILQGEILDPGHVIWVKLWNEDGTQWQLFTITVMSQME